MNTSEILERNGMVYVSGYIAKKMMIKYRDCDVCQFGTEGKCCDGDDKIFLLLKNFSNDHSKGLIQPTRRSHPEVVKAGKEALEKYGAGLSSVRFICGTQDIHKELEDNISKFHGRDDTILYASCFDANAGIFEILLGKEDAVFNLESKLQSSNARIKLIATDGVFSMDGNVTPLPEICDLADKYQALVFVDECHATGFFGKTGRGTEEFFGLNNRVDIINSTLGKALGGAAGGYTTGPKELINLLRQRSRPYLFSNSVPPPVVGCANKVFDFTYGVCRIRRKNSSQYRTFSNPNDKCRFYNFW
ncbi:2-amino-3-ketobutyrate coenzyme A ligase, mitochondrial [Armadillidium vulgare]|nr:2-amino-3-ketobutyrate coenzyme A ligase, mitochondrial [Armadillidium vulgare]